MGSVRLLTCGEKVTRWGEKRFFFGGRILGLRRGKKGRKGVGGVEWGAISEGGEIEMLQKSGKNG